MYIAFQTHQIALGKLICTIAGRAVTGYATFFPLAICNVAYNSCSQCLTVYCTCATLQEEQSRAASISLSGNTQTATWPPAFVHKTCAQLLVVQCCRKSIHWLHHFPCLATCDVASSLCSQNLPRHCWLCNVAGRSVTGCATYLLWHSKMWPTAHVNTLWALQSVFTASGI